MPTTDIAQIVLFLVALLLLAKPLGWYMARVYEKKPCGLDRVLGPAERLIYRLCGVDPQAEMHWLRYAGAVLAFSFAGFVSLYALMRVQQGWKLAPLDSWPLFATT